MPFASLASLENEQPWEFIVITDKKLIDDISTDCRKALLSRIQANPEDYAAKYEKLLSQEGFHIFYHAPAVVYIVSAEKQKNTTENCTLAASYFMMAATNEGLGTCWINFSKSLQDKGIKEKLGLTDEYVIVAPLALGYPKVPKDRKKKVTFF